MAFYPKYIVNAPFDITLATTAIRQMQVLIYNKSKIIGYLVVAMSLENVTMVLDNISKTLLITNPIILIVLFFLARFIAGRFIKPISSIITTSNDITKDNLTSRIALPPQ